MTNNAPEINKHEIICAFLGITFCLGVIFYPVIGIPYAFYEDFKFWSYDPQTNPWGHQYHFPMIFWGRVLGAFLNVLAGYLIHTIQDVSLLRLFSVVVLTISSYCIYYWLRRQRADPILAFFMSIGVLLAPGMQVAIIWSCSIAIPLTILVSILSSLILLRVQLLPRIREFFTHKPNVLSIIWAILLLVASLFLYQPASMFFLVFPLARLLFFARDKWTEIKKQVGLDLSVFAMSCLLYFIINRFFIYSWLANRYPKETNSYDNGGMGYKFNSLSLSQIPEKVSLFFNQMTPLALNIFPYDFREYPAISHTVQAVIMCGFASAIYITFKKEVAGRKLFLFTRYLLITGMVIALIVLANLPVLIAEKGVVVPRTTIIYYAMIYALLVWALSHITNLNAHNGRIKLFRLTLGVVTGVLCLISQHNTLRSALIWSTELKYLQAQIAPHIQNGLKIHIVRARWFNSDMEISTPSSFYWWVTEWMVRSVYASLGKADLFSKVNISSGLKDQLFAESHRLIVDMEAIAETFPHPKHYPAAIEMLENNYFGFSLYSYKYATELNYFAIPMGEYDLDKRVCFSGKCTKTLVDANLNALKVQVENLPFPKGLIASSYSNSSEVDVSGSWASQSSPTYPEWVIVEYKTPQVIQRLRLQGNLDQTGRCTRLARMKAPRDFVFQGSYDKERWDDLYYVKGASFPSDCSWLSWNFPNHTAYKYYRIYITSNNGDPNQVSLNRIELSKGCRYLCRILFAEKVVASSILHPSLDIKNLIATDDSSPPWHSQFPVKFPEWVQFEYTKPTTITRLRMQSQPPETDAYPFLKRAPRDFIVQGSQDGDNWVAILKAEGVQFTGPLEWKQWDVINNTAYKYYRLYITANNGDPNVVSINRLEFGSSQE